MSCTLCSKSFPPFFFWFLGFLSVFFSPARAVRAVALAEGRAGVALDSTRASSLSVGSA